MQRQKPQGTYYRYYSNYTLSLHYPYIILTCTAVQQP